MDGFLLQKGFDPGCAPSAAAPELPSAVAQLSCPHSTNDFVYHPTEGFETLVELGLVCQDGDALVATDGGR